MCALGAAIINGLELNYWRRIQVGFPLTQLGVPTVIMGQTTGQVLVVEAPTKPSIFTYLQIVSAWSLREFTAIAAGDAQIPHRVVISWADFKTF